MASLGWLLWSLIALFFYSLMPPLVKSAMRVIPSYVAVTVTNAILVFTAFLVAESQGYRFMKYLSLSRSSLMLYAAGLVLAVAIIAYYRALELGAISSVVPIYGMHLALSSLWGFLFMGERPTPLKLLGLLFALLAIILLSRP
ncbi:EamA family transporter [Candidatus Bathyarchaeota archaeon]|nr:EamA family transporter [Candidatus Bathyarchaeota archaeon]